METEAQKQLKRIGMGALMAGAGAGVVAILQFVGDQDFGTYTPMVVAFTSILINAARVYFVAPHD